MKARIQLAVNDITRPAAIVDKFCTMRANVSPTRLFTVEASVDNLAPTAPLESDSFPLVDEYIYEIATHNN